MSTIMNPKVEKKAQNYFNYSLSDRWLRKNNSVAMEFVTGNDGSKRNVTDVGTRNPDFKTVSPRWFNQIYSLQPLKVTLSRTITTTVTEDKNASTFIWETET